MSKTVVLKSVVYPDQRITEPVIQELLTSSPVQRLRRIHNAGYHLVAGNFRDQTRYEHSIGVMSLLRLFKASLEEQIAGLLHDISHTAFSHVSTYVLRKKYDGIEFHELQKKKFILNTEIPKILKKHKLNLDEILEAENYSLLENELPDICADRIDYALRDGLIWQAISKDGVRKILKGLTVHRGSFIFKSKEAASLYSNLFFALNQMLYGSAYNAYFNYVFGELVKYAISTHILVDEDWFQDDYYILEKLKASHDPKITNGLDQFNGKVVIYEDRENYTHTFSKKFRVVDPKVLYKGNLHRLSEMDGCYGEKIKRYRQEYPEWKLNISLFQRDL